MFTDRSLTFLLGPAYSKKSLLALDLGVCLATGYGWLGNLCSHADYVFCGFY